MTKSQANQKLYQVYRMLDSISMQFRLNRKLVDHGIVITQDNHPTVGVEMEINPQKSEFAGSCLHECLHLTFPDMREPQVLRLERAMMRKLTDRQLLNLLYRIITKHTKA